jgi:hypothetical protein
VNRTAEGEEPSMNPEVRIPNANCAKGMVTIGHLEKETRAYLVYRELGTARVVKRSKFSMPAGYEIAALAPVVPTNECRVFTLYVEKGESR